MGLIEDENDGGYVAFKNGDNAIVKPKEIKQKEPSGTGQYDNNDYQLEFIFNAARENDTSEQGIIPGWLNSRITVSDSDHTSHLAKLLQSVNALEDVLKELTNGNEAAVEKVLSGDARFVAESDSENTRLMKAVAQNISDHVFRVGTTHNKSGDYSKVDDIYEAADEDPFAETENSDEETDSAEESDSEEKDVLFDEDDETPDTVEEEEL